jgi:hypothetical protein
MSNETQSMNYKKLFLITYWLRKDRFNAFTFLIDLYLIIFVIGIFFI